MLQHTIQEKKKHWLQSTDCAVRDLVAYIRQNGQLRDTQVEAIETYLFLKIAGKNKPLWQLFAEGFFSKNTDLSKLNINQEARDYLAAHPAAFALYDFARTKTDKGTMLPQLEQAILDAPAALDYDSIIKSIFYNVAYADYLMSLPMGAGKTFLMAAIIYLDLYFADKEPDNQAFAHNFLVLIPSGLKSSIVPSLKTILNFDPSWVVPEPHASHLKKLLKFDVLDESKSAKKSNKARNPNAQKVNACLPNPFGQVFVVNAEKVILESFQFNAQAVLELEDEKQDSSNDLKRLFGKLPHLSILIDEVHHAATDDIKLRQAVNYWHSKGNITTVLGFSGTPYLQKQETIQAGDYAFKFSQITNTVYYYPLIIAIQKFLKTPTVKVAHHLERLQIIKAGLEDFDAQYKNKIYQNGAIAKIAIYCSNIEVLEEEVYPYLVGTLGIRPDEILKYHGGNKKYSLPKENEREFRSLDLALSKKRYILLVQVGKEGWDCPSLTAVILSQKGDSPQNMVLQTACRCLRQVDKNGHETALIWLNQDNADTLNKQLKQEQNSSIADLNNAQRIEPALMLARHSRMDYLQVPEVDFYKMKITYQSVEQEDGPQTLDKLQALQARLENYKTNALISTSGMMDMEASSISTVQRTGAMPAQFEAWLLEIVKSSFGLISAAQIASMRPQLQALFHAITYMDTNTNEELSDESACEDGSTRFFNDLYDRSAIESQIRLAFSTKRSLQTLSEVVPDKAQLLIAKNLSDVVQNPKLYPLATDAAKIRDLDASAASVEIDMAELDRAYQVLKETLESQGMGNFVPNYDSFKADKDYSLAVKSKNKSFHYLPYDFGASGSSSLELEVFQRVLQLACFQSKGLEIYYNGERGLTEFVIDCYAKEGRYWKNKGKYTTDFLIIQRTGKTGHCAIHKVLLIETKGALYAQDAAFLPKKKYIETEFLALNQGKFGYPRFDFLYLEGGKSLEDTTALLSQKINHFFQ